MRRAAWSAVPLLLLALMREAGAQQAAQPEAQAPRKPRVFFPSPKVGVFATLTYEQKPGAEVCPGDRALRGELGRRMGYDPFAPNPDGVFVGDIRVVVTRVPGGFAVRYEWTGTSEARLPTGRFEGPGYTRRDCYDVISLLATDLNVSFMLIEIKYGEKFAPKRSAPTCPSAEATPDPMQCVDSRFAVWPDEMPMAPLHKPKPDPPERPERWPVAIRIGGTVSPELVVSGWGSLGLSADVGVRYRGFSASVEAHGDPPLGSSAFPGGTVVSFARLSGALLLCAHWRWFAGCGVGDVGRFIFPDHPRKLPGSIFYGAVGVRAGLEFPVASPRFFLRAGLDVRAPIRPAIYTFGATTVFQVAGPGVGLDFGFLAELPP